MPTMHVMESDMARLFEVADLASGNRSDNEARIRDLCFNAWLGNATSLCRVLGRYKMFIDTDDVGLSTHLLLDGYWEMWTTEAMQRLVKPGLTVVDVGANLGYFTLLLGELVGPTGEVHAFEPNPAMVSRLRRSVAVNGFADRTRIHAVALAADAGQAGFTVPPGEPKNGHLTTVPGDGIPVTLQRLDSLEILPDFIKIDVEGSEELVWRGMAGILAARRPLTILIEFVLDRYADPALFLDEILRHGFRLSRLDPDLGVLQVTCEAVLAANPTADQILVLVR
jgi:FkbM family methyltransferase